MPLIPADALTRVLAGQDPDQPQAPVPPKPILAPLQKFAADPLEPGNYPDSSLTPALKRFVAAPLAQGNYPDSFPTQALERFVANPLGRRNYSPRGVVRRKQ
jgi:hypothetical protein